MFSEFEFGAGLFGDGAGVPVPPTPTPATFQRLKVECKTLTCTGVPDTSLYSIQDAIPSRIVAAAECKTNDCTGIAADSQSYSLQDALYFNGTALTVPVTCPPGATCIPGSFPPTVTYPPGTFVFPDVPLNPGEPINLCLDGCQSTVCRLLPAGSSQAAIQAAANAITLEVATQQAQCDSFPDFPFGTTVELADLSDYACLGGSFADSVDAIITPSSYPATFSIIGGALPAGITMSQNGTTAFFAGAPTTAGASTFTLRATSANGVSATRAYTITVVGITTSSPLPDAVIGEPYSETLTAVGITGSVIWGIAAGSLPAGLVFNTATGEISGIPTASGAVSFSVFVQNATQQCVKTFALDVGECLITTASPLPDATDGVAYSTTLAATDITGTLTWSIIAGSLPTGLSLNTATGEISGTPTTVETANFTAQVENGTGNICSKVFSLEVADACVPDVGPPVPATWSAPQPSGLRIINYASVKAAFGLCATCGTATTEPEFDGTLTVINAPNAFTRDYYPTGTDIALNHLPLLKIGTALLNATLVSDPPSGTARLSFFSGSSWQLRIDCARPDGTGVRDLWLGRKLVGNTPVGTYIRIVSTQAADGPGCIEIEETGCPDWTLIPWDNHFTSATGGGSASFTPNNVPGNSFTAAVDAPGAGDTAQAQNIGSFAYNGDGCNCNLHIDVSNFVGAAAVVVAVVSSLSGVLLNEAPAANGSFDYPITVPTTGGMASTISVQVTLQANPANPESVTVSGIFTNI